MLIQSLTGTSAASDAVDPQATFDWASEIWWDPSSLFHTSIDSVGYEDSAS